MPERTVLFGTGAGGPSGAQLSIVPEVLRIADQADSAGLDLFALAGHPYFADRLDAYATLGIVLGRTSRITGVVTVTNLPARPAPVLAHTITSLSALSGGRVVLGIGAGGLWDEITKLGVRRLSAGAAVRAMEEAIILVKALSGGSAGQWIEELTGAVLEHGAAGSLYREELEHTSDQALRRWAEDIVPAVRDAVAKV